MRSVKFEPKAFSQIEDWLAEDRKMFQRILRILTECQRTLLKVSGSQNL
jgi:Txe/YoeB family toxin of Txe-Axe toxin-antitoxin module